MRLNVQQLRGVVLRVLTALFTFGALLNPFGGALAGHMLNPSELPDRTFFYPAEEILAHRIRLPQDECIGGKNQSVLRAQLKVVNGSLALDRDLSKGGFETSDLFRCRAGLNDNEKRKQRFEKELLSDLDRTLRQLPRFYLQSLTNVERAELITYLPLSERDELIPFLKSDEKLNIFYYLPEDEQLKVVTDLDLKQKKEFFPYLPEEEQKKVLVGLPEEEKNALATKKKQNPPQTPAPKNEAERKAVSEYSGTGKSSKVKNAGSWEGYVGVYNAWQSTRVTKVPMADALDSYLTNNLRGKVLSGTAIFGFDTTAFDTASEAANPSTGHIALHVTDPIGDLSFEADETNYKIIVPQEIKGVTDAEYVTPSKSQIINLLKSLKGQLWESGRIKAYINDYFTRDRSGYERSADAGNALEIDEAEAEPKRIIVRPVPFIARITFLGTVEQKEIRVALRQLLSDKELKSYRRNPKLLEDCKEEESQKPPAKPASTPDGAPVGEAITIKCQRINYQELAGGVEKLPYLNLRNWRLQQVGLTQEGFKSTLNAFDPTSPKPVEDEGAESNEASSELEETSAADSAEQEDDKIIPLYVEIRISKSSTGDESLIKTGGATGGNDGAAGNNHTAPGGIAGGETPVSPQPTPENSPTPTSASSPIPTPVNSPTPTERVGSNNNSSVDAARSKKRTAIEKPKRNRVGGELVYRPDQGVRVYGQYAHLRPGKDDFSVRFGGYGGLLVNGDYEGVDLFRGIFERRFPFNVQGYSDSVASRIFNNIKLDERRTGGAFRVKTDLMSNPTQLTLSLDGRRETVELANKDHVLAKQNITSINIGAIYSSSSSGIRFRRVWQVEPTLRFGLGLSEQPGFSVLRLSGLLHQFLPNRFDLIFDGRLDLASRRTPLFEQPSFGGEETVRGFRADDAIGRKQWALKNEVNMPVPGTSPDSGGIFKLLRERMQMAAFVDVGGVYQTTGSKPGVRFGPGAGLRFNYREAIMKFDWAYGIGEAATGRGRGRFYFSISREIPRLIRGRSYDK